MYNNYNKDLLLKYLEINEVRIIHNILYYGKHYVKRKRVKNKVIVNLFIRHFYKFDFS